MLLEVIVQSAKRRDLLRCTARHGLTSRAVAERLADIGTQTEFEQPAGEGVGIYTGGDGYLYCDSLRIDDIRDQVCGYQPACKSSSFLASWVSRVIPMFWVQDPGYVQGALDVKEICTVIRQASSVLGDFMRLLQYQWQSQFECCFCRYKRAPSICTAKLG